MGGWRVWLLRHTLSRALGERTDCISIYIHVYYIHVHVYIPPVALCRFFLALFNFLSLSLSSSFSLFLFLSLSLSLSLPPSLPPSPLFFSPPPCCRPVASLIVQHGTLKCKDVLVAGKGWAKVRAMFNEHREPLKIATPSTPVLTVGWREMPTTGLVCYQVCVILCTYNTLNNT